MISHEHKIIFIHCHKCGGESIEQAIFGKSDTGYNGDQYEGSPRKHWGYQDYITEYGADICEEYFVFSFVRNPWDQIISRLSYRNKRFGEEVSINSDEIKRVVQFWCKKSCASLTNNGSIDFIGRFENLDKDFSVVCEKIGFDHVTLPHVNKSNHKHYTEYYDAETKQLVAEKYAKDIEYFGYEFGYQ